MSLAILLLIGALPGQMPALAAQETRVQQAPNVQLTMYMESYMQSLCPQHSEYGHVQAIMPAWLRHSMRTIMESDFADIVDLKFRGNAAVEDEDKGKFACQHGAEDLCGMNKIINCVMRFHPRQSDWLPWAACVEGAAKVSATEEQAESCAKDANFGWDQIRDCADSELQMTAQDVAVAPNPRPWVIVNGVPIFDYSSNLKTILCLAYTGDRPASCFEPPQVKQMSLRDFGL